jgi:eukaryotic-like serine/threonine-protein kinase
VHGVGPSTVLGGRYAVQRRLEQQLRAERWSAHDTTLERDVVVVVFPADDPNADATLDAARRAAGVDNERLVRILDVGRSEDVAFFVEEALHEAHTVTHLLEQGGLPSEEVRRIAGETAAGLEAARGRGLHHLQLTPSSVWRTGDGDVKVTGLATAAALAGVDELGSTEASRTDAVGVVALAYAALTSRWPLPGKVPGLEAAPHVVGGVPAPSEIAAGVPGDLDALCRLTLNDDQGPLTPGDFATQIAPWSRGMVTGLGGTATQPVAVGDLSTSSRGVDKTLALPLPGRGGSAVGTSGRPAPPAEPAAQPDSDHDPDADAAGDSDPGQQHTAAAAATAVAGALGTAGHAAGQAAGAAAGKVGSFARAAADKAAEKRAARVEAHEQAERSRVSLEDALLAGDDDVEPPLPMLPPETAAAPTRDQSKMALAIIAAFVALATLVGFWGVSQFGSNTGIDLSGSTPRPTVTVTGPAQTVTPGDTPTQEPSTDEAGEPLAILKATGFDPEGDGSERNSEVPRVYDGDTSSFWSSEGYATSNLGGLKPGVGVIVDLGQPAKVKEVTLALPDAADVTVYVGEDRDRDGATELGSSAGKKGKVTITAKDAEVAGKYVIVWYTELSKVDDGRFRATLAEITVR